MPSLYLANQTSTKAIPMFAERGLSNLAPTKLADVTFYITTSLYSMLKYHLAFIFKVLSQNKNRNNYELDYVNIFKPIATLDILYEIPVGTFRFSGLSDDKQAELRALGLQQDPTNRNLFVGSPAISSLPTIGRYGPLEDRIRPGHLTFDAYRAWAYLMKGIMIFTTTTYSVKKPYANLLLTNSTKDIPSGQSAKICGVDGKYTHMEEAPAGYSIDLDTGSFMYAPPEVPISFTTQHIQTNDDIPSLPHSIFFPYFAGMNVMDKDTCFGTFHELFSSHLSSTADANNKILASIRSGCRQLAFSKTGICLSHIYKCIEICLKVPDSRLTVVLSGATYQGCLISSVGEFSITVSGSTVACGDSQEDIKAINKLSTQAEKVAELLNSASSGTSSVIYTFKKEDFLSSRVALHNFYSVEKTYYSTGNAYETAIDVLTDMVFGDSFPNPTPDLIGTCVSYMRDGQFDKIRHYPAYITRQVLNATNKRVMEALSMFGPKVPSFSITSAKEGFGITVPSDGQDSIITKVNGQRQLKYFPFWSVPIGDGHMQWSRFISSGVMYFPHPRKGRKEFVNQARSILQIGSDPLFTNVYNDLKSMVQDSRKQGKDGKKRSRDGDNDDAPGIKRQKKSVAEEMEDF